MWSTPKAVPQVATARLDAGEVAGHDVGVALDDDGLAARRDRLLGEVEAVEHGRLLVDRRLGGVEVLRLDAVVVEEPAGAEADGVAGDVADRPDQAPAEPVVEAAAPAPGEAAGDELVVGEALGAQVAARASSPPRGAKPMPNCLAARAVEAALAQEVAAGPGLGRPVSSSSVGVELLRRPGAPRPAGERRPSLPPRAAGRRPPRSAAPCRASAASRSTASAKVRWSTFWTNEMTSPPSPQPKQW